MTVPERNSNIFLAGHRNLALSHIIPVSFLALTVVFQIRPIRDTLCLIEDLKPAKRVARVKLTLTTRTVDADRRGGAIINARQEEHDLFGEAENGGSIAFRS